MSGWRLIGAVWAFAVLGFLALPVLAIIPLSFLDSTDFSLRDATDSGAFSLRWYRALVEIGPSGRAGLSGWAQWREVWLHAEWVVAARNSVAIGLGAAALATILGTLAALGLIRLGPRARRLVLAVFMLPMVVPVIVAATGMFFVFASACLPADHVLVPLLRSFLSRNLCVANTNLALVLAHGILGAPFVVITVLASLSRVEPRLLWAAASLGAGPLGRFYRVTFPLIRSGVVAGAVFAFLTSIDEVVTVLLLAGPEQNTLPRQMWSGLRDTISPSLLAASTMLTLWSLLLLAVVAWLQNPSRRR